MINSIFSEEADSGKVESLISSNKEESPLAMGASSKIDTIEDDSAVGVEEGEEAGDDTNSSANVNVSSLKIVIIDFK